MKWWVVGQRAGTFDFREGEVVRFAQAQGVKVRGHCLVWDHTNPESSLGMWSTRLCDRNLQT
jgi:GH35 family endo-1,4-beta-xylanase